MNKFKKTPLFSFELSKKPEEAMPSEEAPKKKKWCIRCILWKALVRTCTALGALFLISAVIGAFMSVQKEVLPDLPREMVLYLPLDEGFPEHSNNALAALAFGDPPLTIRAAVDALEDAATDKRVKGVVAQVKGGHYSLTQIQELRTALAQFKASGEKFSYIYAESYDGIAGGLGTYYLASAFDEIWMQPMGSLSMAGISVEMPFARALLDKLGVTPDFVARKEYKSLFESFTNTEMSAATREATRAMVDDLAGQISTGIAESRGMTTDDVRKAVDMALLTDEEALAAQLVSRLDDADMLERTIRERVSGDPDGDVSFVTLAGYARGRVQERRLARLEPVGAASGERAKVALIYLLGPIISYVDDAPYGENVAGADELADYINRATEEEDVRAIILRVDSPGGSPSASETIRRALVRAQAKGKTVVVSMGAVAASGGYWVSAPADRIFALPSTLTGSIGVAGGKFVLAGLWDKVGVNWDGLQWGDNAGMWSMNSTFSAGERARFEAMMDRTYDGFIARVAEGRHMTEEQADNVARGRVWTGAQALDNGLVDELGGLNSALGYVATTTGVADRAHLDVVVLPRALTPVEQLMALLEGQVMMRDVLKSALTRFDSLLTDPLASGIPVLRVQ